LLLHGNSSCKEVFHNQLNGAVGESCRLIAMDLPGHGASSNAHDPQRTYTMPGYAEAVIEALEQMSIHQLAVFGWSLGGHVALEMIPRSDALVGLMISGAPPVGRSLQEIQAGFRPNPQIGLAGKADFTPEDVEIFGAATTGYPLDPMLRDAILRTDGRARAVMFASLFTGGASDERMLAENSPVPLAIVNGADDPLVNVEYIEGLAYRNLWDSHCYKLRGVGHAPFLQAPDPFNAIFLRFAAEMTKRAAHAPAGGKKSKFVAA
jgi:pimeloyl-ACP methyl ester carboxylesterase